MSDLRLCYRVNHGAEKVLVTGPAHHRVSGNRRSGLSANEHTAPSLRDQAALDVTLNGTESIHSQYIPRKICLPRHEINQPPQQVEAVVGRVSLRICGIFLLYTISKFLSRFSLYFISDHFKILYERFTVYHRELYSIVITYNEK